MVWHRAPPRHHYWERVSHTWHAVLTITPAQPSKPWIELQTGAVARFKYLASA